MAQQTAVDWLVQKYFNDYNMLISELEYDKAKQMEKEQILDAWVNGNDNEPKEVTQDYAEQYYNETYKK